GVFSGTGKSEEQGYISVFTFIGRTVHAQYFMFLRKQVIQYTENAFFHFASVGRTANQDNFTSKVYDSEITLTGTINCRISIKARSLQNEPILIIVGNFFFCRTQKEVIAE